MTKKSICIRNTFDLTKPLEKTSEVVGISNLNGLEDIEKKDVLGSRGEFAGFICDKSQVTLFRDRLGARNIYYSLKGDILYVSTDLDWIAQNVNSAPNWDHILSDYLQFQIPFTDDTFFKDIKKVMPGELVHIHSKEITKEKYWEIQFGNESFDAQHFCNLIKDAVDYRVSLIEGKNYTSYLSGGTDSSAITLLSKPKVCFSGFYDEDGYSELDYIHTLISKSGFLDKYIPVEIKEKIFHEQLLKLPQMLADPCAGLGVIPQVLVAQDAARNGYKYAFTGEGGDEIAAGYNWNTIVFSLAEATRHLLRDRYMVRYEPMIEKVLRDGFATFTGGLLARGDDILYATKRILDIWKLDEPVENNIMRINLTLGLPAILTVDEQVGKYAGIEPISPLIDHHIVEYACSIRPQDRAPIPKYMIREALKGILPEKIRMRYDKMGFPVPYQNWNWSLLKPMIHSLKNRNVIDIDEKKHTTMDRKTWALYTIEMWYQHYFERKQ